MLRRELSRESFGAPDLVDSIHWSSISNVCDHAVIISFSCISPREDVCMSLQGSASGNSGLWFTLLKANQMSCLLLPLHKCFPLWRVSLTVTRFSLLSRDQEVFSVCHRESRWLPMFHSDSTYVNQSQRLFHLCFVLRKSFQRRRDHRRTVTASPFHSDHKSALYFCWSFP